MYSSSDTAIISVGALLVGHAPNVIPASAEVDYRWRYPVTINDAAATTFAEDVARAFVGESGLIPSLPAGLPSDDFGLMLKQVPGSYFVVGNGTGTAQGEGGCMVHNAGYDFNDRILPSTASFFVTLAQAYLKR